MFVKNDEHFFAILYLVYAYKRKGLLLTLNIN